MPQISIKHIKTLRKTHWRKLRIGFAFLALVASVPVLSAFEARVIKVTAEFAQIDPPILTPPGSVPLGDTTGGVGLTGTVTVDMTHTDPDGAHIFYTFGPGTDPNTIPDPVCGNSGPNAGGGAINVGELNIITLSFDSDTTIKAITCDGNTASAHKSIINIKRYFFESTPPPNDCTDQEFIIPNNLSILGAGDGTGKSDIAMGAISEIRGNAHSNRNIGPEQPPLTREILGNASAGGTVANAIDVSGAVTEGSSDISLPELDQTFWKTQAVSGGEIPGDVEYAANSPDILLGPVSILGDLKIGPNNDIILTGPVYVGGKLIIHPNVEVHQHQSQANKLSLILVDGLVDIKPNVTFTHAGSGAFLIVGNNAAVAGTGAAIEIGANGSNQRIVILATGGDARIHSNGHIAAVFALNGFNSSDPAVRLNANSLVEGGPFPGLIGCGEPQEPPDPCDEKEGQTSGILAKNRGGLHDDEDEDECDDNDDDNCDNQSNNLGALGRGGSHDDEDECDDEDEDDCIGASNNNKPKCEDEKENGEQEENKPEEQEVKQDNVQAVQAEAVADTQKTQEPPPPENTNTQEPAAPTEQAPAPE